MAPSGNRIRHILAILFLFATVYQVALSAGIMAWLARGADRRVPPFAIRTGETKIRQVSRAAASAGLRNGDELVEIDGRPYTGRAVWAIEFRRKHAGETMTFAVRSPGADSPRTISIPLESAGRMGPYGWPVVITIYVITQFCALLLGFAVALIRPRDPMAWLLLLMMVSFAGFCASGDVLRDTIRTWPDVFRQAAMFYHVTVRDTWAIGMLLFGVYFGGRLELDRRAPWLKWLLMIPIAFSAIVDGAYHVAETENVHSAVGFQRFVAVTDPVSIYLGMAAVSLFFFALWSKAYDPATEPDAGRRLRLVAWGATVALTPLFFVAVWWFLLHRSISEQIVLLCILPLAIFPLTLAYVIVVHRALDVRVVIRQGLRYALATNGLRALIILLIVGINMAAANLASNPNVKRPYRATAIALSIALIFLIRKPVYRLRNWVDRRFFREAYDAEQILSDLGEKVRRIIETGPLLETVTQRIAQSLHVPRIATLLLEGGHYVPAHAFGYGSCPDIRFAETAVVVERLRTLREPLRIYLDDPNSWINRDGEIDPGERAGLKALGSELLLPLEASDKLLGFVSLGPKQSEEPYSGADVRLLKSVAAQTGLALENSRLAEAVAREAAQRERLSREVEIAREVQQRLFPQTLPHVPGLDYAGACRPAAGVGGDYYDFLALAGGNLGIAIGDVSGKGIPAALLMASLQASLRGQTITGTGNLAEMMATVNRLMYDASPPNRYATFFYAQYEAATRRLTYVNAGHNSPVLFRPCEGSQQIVRLEEGGPVVGLFRPACYQQATIDLCSGDLLIAFTDGISEAMNGADEEWGEERLIETGKACNGLSAIGVIDRIMAAADAFATGAPQHDDMTLVVLRVL